LKPEADWKFALRLLGVESCNQNFGVVFISGGDYIQAMMRGGTMRALVMATFVLGVAGTKVLIAEAAGNPYQGIAERNVFNLKPPPPATPPEPPPPPAPKITLTGITTILGNKRALLKLQEPAKPPQAAKEVSYILTEGQRDGDIEILAIDEQAGTVKVNNHGTVQELSFDKDGVKLSNNPLAPPLSPNLPGVVARTPPGPNENPLNPALKRIPGPTPLQPPTRTLRLPQLPQAPGSRPPPPGAP
jgi:hypothetical protein